MQRSVTLNPSKLILPAIFLKQHCLTLSYVVSKNGKKWGETEGKKPPSSITSQALLSHSRSCLSKHSCWWHCSQHCCFLQTLAELTVLGLPRSFMLYRFPLGMPKTILVMEKKSIIFKLKAWKTFTLFWNFFRRMWINICWEGLNYCLTFPI